jgi:hypothetical protein
MFQVLQKAIDNLAARLADFRESRRPRHWKFVNGFGPGQVKTHRPMTHSEAVKFIRQGLGGSYMETDLANSIIFYAPGSFRRD